MRRLLPITMSARDALRRLRQYAVIERDEAERTLPSSSDTLILQETQEGRRMRDQTGSDANQPSIEVDGMETKEKSAGTHETLDNLIEIESNVGDIESENAMDSDQQFFIRILDVSGKCFSVDCDLDWTVLALKKKIVDFIDVPVSCQRLIYRGSMLVDDHRLLQCHVEKGHTIHLFARRNQIPAESTENDANIEVETSNERSNGQFVDDESSMVMMHISTHGSSSAVYPSDSARAIDPLILDSPLGNAARRVKLWSSFFLIIHTMRVMGQFALLANYRQAHKMSRENAFDSDESDLMRERMYQYGPYYKEDPAINAAELIVHVFGVYVACVGFKAAHGTDIRSIRFYCRGLLWLSVFTVLEQVYTTYQISNSDLLPHKNVELAYGQQSALDDIVSANIFQAITLIVMWMFAIHHAYVHLGEVARFNQSFAQAAINTVPLAHIPTEIVV